MEGKNDVTHLSNLYDSCFVMTNGYVIPKEEITFLKSLPKNINVIVLTDNDEAGETIRKRLNEIRDDFINIRINANNNKKKKGIAECNIKDIESALEKYVSQKKINSDYDLYLLGLEGMKNSATLRKLVADKFNLGLCSKSNMIKRLNLLNISNNDLKEFLNNAKGN